ncbi:hypothetical protein AAU57_08425 [Nonlabens sp. YIK11]|uniref:DUF6531 domain-containing protein n=1 Tax=Nonlabens sp. YIK11 TaxID=1453349 RepID=UPI0006DCB1EC|nr:DUF6531 domain-containing protein [Nonlabens sp. YIK11]KQC33336.1 hypothetical protein AAU57_08425 [Nonlabens sp. YIK11]
MKFIASILIFLLSIHLTVAQNVNLKNGNYFMSFADVDFQKYSGIKEDFLVRTYNSKSTVKGWFGYGWGSRLETKLYYYPDYSVMIQEHGAGGKSIFTTALQDDILSEELIEDIIDIEIEQGLLDDIPTTISSRRKKLTDFREVRLVIYDRYVQKGYFEPFLEVPEGVTWQTFARGSDKQLVFKNGQFIRSSRNGEKEYFNLEGDLVKIIDTDGNSLTIQYQDGKPKKISSPDEFYLDITTNEDGFITAIETSDQQKAELKYNNDNLVYSKDANGNLHAYEYDVNHNLTKIIYNPVRLKGQKIDARIIEYTPKTMYASKITDRDGDVTEYSYKNFFTEDGEKDDDHYATTVITSGWNGEKVENYYEYLIGKKPNGERYTEKIITRIRGVETVSTYDENCNAPTRIERNGRWTTMQFDKNCNMIEKVRSNGDHIKLEYHPTLKKLIRVEQNNTVNKFEYDKKGKVILAQKNDEEPIELKYADNGKITHLISGDTIIDFDYNELGKPVRIAQKGLGEMRVTYDDNGEILKVESDGGSSITLKITQSFQKLLALTKVPNVDFNM